MNLAKRNIEAHKLGGEFRNTFNRSLAEFWNPITGFDVIKFDEQLVKPPDGVSTRQHLSKTKGKRAEQLIEKLIGI